MEITLPKSRHTQNIILKIYNDHADLGRIVNKNLLGDPYLKIGAFLSRFLV